MRNKAETRTCSACREKAQKSELLRIVRTPEGNIVFDRSRKMNGRGAYLCRKPACLEKAKKSSSIRNSLGCPIPDEVFAELEREISNAP